MRTEVSRCEMSWASCCPPRRRVPHGHSTTNGRVWHVTRRDISESWETLYGLDYANLPPCSSIQQTATNHASPDSITPLPPMRRSLLIKERHHLQRRSDHPRQCNSVHLHLPSTNYLLALLGHPVVHPRPQPIDRNLPHPLTTTSPIQLVRNRVSTFATETKAQARIPGSTKEEGKERSCHLGKEESERKEVFESLRCTGAKARCGRRMEGKVARWEDGRKAGFVSLARVPWDDSAEIHLTRQLGIVQYFTKGQTIVLNSQQHRTGRSGMTKVGDATTDSSRSQPDARTSHKLILGHLECISTPSRVSQHRADDLR
jgi:hypothetical protein